MRVFGVFLFLLIAVNYVLCRFVPAVPRSDAPLLRSVQAGYRGSLQRWSQAGVLGPREAGKVRCMELPRADGEEGGHGKIRGGDQDGQSIIKRNFRSLCCFC